LPFIRSAEASVVKIGAGIDKLKIANAIVANAASRQRLESFSEIDIDAMHFSFSSITRLGTNERAGVSVQTP